MDSFDSIVEKCACTNAVFTVYRSTRQTHCPNRSFSPNWILGLEFRMYVLQVNGLYVGDAETERVKAEIACTDDVLHLVLARNKPHNSKVGARTRPFIERNPCIGNGGDCFTC